MLEGDAFVAEISTNLINAFQSTHEQSFQIELKGNSQEEVLMELVMMGDKGPRSCAAIDGLQDGGFHFDEVVLVQELAQEADGCRPDFKDLLYIRVHSQVDIALAVAGFRVAQRGMPDDLTVDDFVFGGRAGDAGLWPAICSLPHRVKFHRVWSGTYSRWPG